MKILGRRDQRNVFFFKWSINDFRYGGFSDELVQTIDGFNKTAQLAIGHLKRGLGLSMEKFDGCPHTVAALFMRLNAIGYFYFRSSVAFGPLQPGS